MLIDLQLHSTYSDGYLTPTELVGFLLKNKVKIGALTDHNTVGGLEEFHLACKKNKIKPIDGLEIYVKLGHKKFNLLWYNFDYKNPYLHKFLRLSQIRRREQMRRALLRLKELDLTIDENKILDKYNHYIPANHVIEEVWQLVDSQSKAAKCSGGKKPPEDSIINHLFTNLKECYINFSHILILKKKIGGQIILNHPGKDKRINKNFIAQLKKIGLDGVEVISPHHSIKSIMRLQRLAKRYKLIMTGGSDYHLDEGGAAAIKNIYAYFKVESKYLNDINKIIG